MTKAEQVQAILDRTTKDITTIKELLDNPGLAKLFDWNAKAWLETLRGAQIYVKNKDI